MGAAPAGRLDVSLLDLRNAKGQIHLCLTRDPDFFPDCAADPDALKRSAPASETHGLAFAGLPSGNYALSAVHDENGNGRLDTIAGIPREGFGFSRNPRIRFGPPTFDQTSFKVFVGEMHQNVQMKYLL